MIEWGYIRWCVVVVFYSISDTNYSTDIIFNGLVLVKFDIQMRRTQQVVFDPEFV